MTQSSLRPVILCGGAGQRLWPLSRSAHPMQFTPVLGDDSPLVATLRRVADLGLGRPMLLTGADYRFLVAAALETAGIAGDVVIEPARRNTAPALAAAAALIGQEDPEAALLVLPSDHRIGDPDAFAAALEAARGAGGGFVTFGIRPDRAETGYGYIELDAPPESTAAVPYRRFVEKPGRAAAEEMLASGRYLWNSGMFLLPVAGLRTALETHAPEVQAAAVAAADGAARDPDFIRLGAAFAGAPDISVDYAVMEKAPGLVVPLDAGWNDLGSWQAVWQVSDRDGEGVATSGAVTALDCAGSLLRSEHEDMHLVGIGLKNVVAVAMRDAVLVADMDRAQEVKAAVAALKAKGAPQAGDFPRCHRPWGWYETLDLGTRFQVKRIMVKPGGVLSLQSHHHRAEHWIVVAGTAKVTVGEDVRLLGENESVYIPLGAVHRMENPGKVEMHLIEVQTGVYLGEDDIVRYEDIYARV